MPMDFGTSEIISFFKSINNDEFNQQIDQAVQHIAAAERIIFVGVSTSARRQIRCAFLFQRRKIQHPY